MSQGGAGRRSTLASVENNWQQPAAPASAMKSSKNYGAGANGGSSMLPRQSSIARASLAPGRLQGTGAEGSRLGMSSAAGSAPRSSGAPMSYRQSVQQHDDGQSSVQATPYGSRSMGVGMRSSAAGSVAGRQSVNGPTPNAMRRSIGGRQSMAPGMGPGIHSVRALTEPRPLRSRPFMEEVKERVFDFLQRTGFSAPGFSHKSMNDPTQTHFLSMFRHIYNKSIDNTYTFTKDSKREADEIISLLNDIKYPLIGDLSKMKLGAAGSAQNWPSIVAMLDWIVCMNSTFANDTKYGGAGPLERELEDEQDDQQLFYKFLWECYDKFWQNQDTFPDEVAALDQIFAERNAGVTKQVEELEAEELKLDQQLREYTDHDSPLTKQTREKELLEGDITKFIKYRDDILLPKLAKSKGTLKALNEQIEQKLAELKRAEQEAVALKKQVDSQGISESDFDAMTREKETLLKQSHDIAEENNDAAKRSWNLELEVSKLQSRVEELFKTFNSLARKVGLFPLDLKDGSGSQLQELEIVPRNPSTMLPPGVDIKSLIKPAIERLRSQEVERFKKICEECLLAQDNVDRISEELTAVRETHIALQGRLDRQQEIFEETLAVNGSEHQAIESKKADDEAKLLQMQQAGHLAMQHAEARLSSLKRQLQTAKQNDEQHRLALHRELEAAALDVANLKMKVAAAIEKLGQDAQRL